jgi:predicted dehydrogenase/threonine dehydrogenase-like Zn-dependent dehydrogenase
VKQVVIRKGNVAVEEVPAPKVEPGTVLVRTVNSCISIGTEMSGVKASGVPLWKRALRDPGKVKKVLGMVATQGIAKTRHHVEGKLGEGRPTGYSASGIVLEAGEGVDDLRPGDQVAVAGAQCAFHAEILRIPRNLAVPIPAGVGFPVASTVALGAIALQGVRRAQPTLGEVFVVVGLGAIGQLTVQILKANGVRVIALDMERSRVRTARYLGADAGFHPGEEIDVEAVARMSAGAGADGVIIGASSPSDDIVSSAFRMCRKKGRVVLVGDVGLNLNREDFYAKELDFLISTSYGPGRYDRRFEEEGLDYPLGYVRWTESRNMTEVLRLAGEGKVRIEPMISETFPMGEAAKAYGALKGEGDRPLMVLLSYPEPEPGAEPLRVVSSPSASPGTSGTTRMALVGAGAFARNVHLPNIRTLSDKIHLVAVVDRLGLDANEIAGRFDAKYATTDFGHVLNDGDVDSLLIATRHNLHASMTLEALKAGKHVLVEKPLALTRAEMEAIESFYASAGDGAPILLTGFNRIFSTHIRRIREMTLERGHPMILNYRMNAGYIPKDHWVHGAEGGGRNLGEACHIYHLFTFLTGARVLDVHAAPIQSKTGHYFATDNFIASLAFDDGSVASLTYTALGSDAYPKERMEVFFDGKVVTLDRYKRTEVAGGGSEGVETRAEEKGHREELEAFASAVHRGGDWPIPLWQQLQATEIALRVEAQLRGE